VKFTPKRATTKWATPNWSAKKTCFLKDRLEMEKSLDRKPALIEIIL